MWELTKDNNVSELIASKKSLKELILNERHYVSYLSHLSEKGVSQGHRVNVETSLRLLEKGFKERSKRFSDNLFTLI